MFKSFQDTSALQQFHGFPNLNMQQATSAYGFSGVTFWLDAAYGLNTQTNLGAVSRWQARVGGNIFEQATAGSQPSLVLNDAAFNNLPTINTSTNRFMSSSIGGLNFNFNGTIAFISKYDSLSSANALIGNSSNTNSIIFLGGSNAGYNGVGFNNSAGTTFQSTIEDANAKICILTSFDIIVNGTNVFNNNSNTVFPDLLLNQIGKQGTTSAHLQGKIAEILYFNYRLSSDEAIALSNNINQKYALY